MHLELVNLTLRLHKSREDTKKMGMYFNMTNGKKKQSLVCLIIRKYNL